MSRCISFRDLKLIPELSGFSEMQMLQPAMDAVIYPYLALLGIDVEYTVSYVPNVHRDMQGKVALGLMARGQVSINRNDINGPFMGMEDRLQAVAFLDRSLLEEMAELSGKMLDYRGDGESIMEDEPFVTFFPYEMQEPDYLDVENMIARLTDACARIRKRSVTQ